MKIIGLDWFEDGATKVHLGVDPDFRPARKAHPGLLVAQLRDLVARLREDRPSRRRGRAPGGLRVGEKVPLRVEVEYTLGTAQSGTITLVVQQGEQGHEPLANETQVIQKGGGKLVLTKEIEVPDTNAIQVFTPLSAQGATSTSVVDARAYGVAKR